MGDSYIAKNATVTFVGSSISTMCTTDFALDITSTVDEYVCLGGDGWTNKLQGAKSWNASWGSSLDDTVGIDLANTVGESGLLTIDTVDGKSYSGTAIITGSSPSGDATTRAVVAWTADGNGAITEA